MQSKFENITASRDGQYAILSIKSPKQQRMMGIFVLIIFAATEAGRIAALFKAEAKPTAPLPLMLFSTTITLCLAYIVAAAFLNARRVKIGAGRLQMAPAPLPFIGTKNVDATRVLDVWSTPIGRGFNKPSRGFRVWIKKQDAKDDLFLPQVVGEDETKYVVAWLRENLGLPDGATKRLS